ncbi:MAG: ribbon-helix-helix protein, CopG family [Chloroflexi bacterium]|nr:ribbon-helix-helix protein, CopG family [Chloroflexota bacterium]
MSKLKRKNLIVDGEKVSELAQRRGISESEAVRQAVDFALAAEEVMAAVRELHERGGIEDVFGRLPDEAGN